MADYSNLTRLGILNVDPGSILGTPSPNAYKPLPYLPLMEPLQKPDFSGVAISTGNDTYNHEGQVKNDRKAKRVQRKLERQNAKAESGKFNWKKWLGISSVALLALIGIPKLVKNFPKLLKSISNIFKKTP